MSDDLEPFWRPTPPPPQIEAAGFGHGMSWPRAIMWTAVGFAGLAALLGIIFLLLYVLPAAVVAVTLGACVFVGIAALIKTSP